MRVTINVSGAQKATSRLSAEQMHVRMRRAIAGLVIEAEGRIKQKLSGEVLHVRSGALRSSIASRVEESGSSIVGVTGTRIKYARVYEYGYSGQVTVGAHTRRSGAQMKSATYSYINSKGERVYKVRKTGKKGIGTGVISVREHVRQVNIKERSFMRSTLREMAADVRAGILGAVR